MKKHIQEAIDTFKKAQSAGLDLSEVEMVLEEAQDASGNTLLHRPKCWHIRESSTLTISLADFIDKKPSLCETCQEKDYLAQEMKLTKWASKCQDILELKERQAKGQDAGFEWLNILDQVRATRAAGNSRPQLAAWAEQTVELCEKALEDTDRQLKAIAKELFYDALLKTPVPGLGTDPSGFSFHLLRGESRPGRDEKMKRSPVMEALRTSFDQWAESQFEALLESAELILVYRTLGLPRGGEGHRLLKEAYQVGDDLYLMPIMFAPWIMANGEDYAFLEKRPTAAELETILVLYERPSHTFLLDPFNLNANSEPEDNAAPYSRLQNVVDAALIL